MVASSRSALSVFSACAALIALAGCKPSGFASRQADGLTSSDVHGSARLTTVERKAHVDNCVGQRQRLIATFATIKRVGTSGANKIAEDFDKYFPPFCECLVNQVEDRGSKLQVLMVMSAIEQVGTVPWSGQGPDFSAFRTAAKRHGMSDGAFDQVRKETHAIQASAAALCVRHIRNA